MKDLLVIIIKVLGDNFTKLVALALTAIKSFFDFKKANIEHKENNTIKQEQTQYEKQIDDAIDNGNIEDLLDLKRKG